MKPCNHKIKMTPEEEKSLDDSVLEILTNGLNTVRKRFPNINDVNGKAYTKDEFQKKYGGNND